MAKKGRYTKYSNKIGLYSNSKGGYINNSTDVVLNFPFKDTVLEAGMSKEDVGREERFLHQELDSKDIDTLEEPKVLTGFSLIDKDGEKSLTSKSEIEFFDEDGNLKQNLLIKGNNLLALYTLREKLANKVKLIYIDPPYNTGSDGFRYNDSFNHSAWLAFMKNRLEVAKELLSDDGVIFVQCDDNEQAYLKVLMDEVFGKSNYINTIVIKAKAVAGASGGGEDKRLKKNFEFILFYAKQYEFAEFQQPDPSLTKISDYIQEHKENNVGFYYTRIIKNYGDKELIGTIQAGGGGDIKIYRHTNYEFSSISKVVKEENISTDEAYEKYFDDIFMVTNAQTSILEKVNDFTKNKNELISYEYVPRTGKDKGKITTKMIWNHTLVVWFSDTALKKDDGVYKAEGKGALWSDISWGRLDLEGGVSLKAGKKPENLIRTIIDMATEENDIVLDFCLGSGTTSAVAHKMNRRWIGIEQMDYIEDVAKERLKRVIAGEQGGVSASVGWNGGSSFVYFELKKYNQEYVDRIMQATSLSELEDLYVDMRNNAFLKFWFDRNEFEKDENFRKLDIEQRKQKLIDVLDENQLYLNYADMGDTRHKVTDDEKVLTERFYGASEN
jgi:adenine-specific DNA-methyltransferase